MRRMILAITVLLALPVYAQAQLIARFDPANSIVPSANNLLFFGSTDGTLNVPFDPNDASAPLIQTLNALDGFSTVTPVTTSFSGPLDPNTLIAGDSVRVFEVVLDNPFLNPGTDTAFVVTEVLRELTPNVDYTLALTPVDPSGSTLAIIPLRPLAAKTGHMVVLTDSLRGADGSLPLPDQTYIFARYPKGPLIDENGSSKFRRLSDAQAQSLEPIRKIVVSQEDAAAGQGIARSSIVFSWTFLTQSISDSLAAVHATVEAQPAVLLSTGAATPLGAGRVYAGTLQVPYYLDAVVDDPSVVLRSRWLTAEGNEITRYTPLPAASQDITIPLLASIPNGPKPANGWPLAIFQHGVLINRTVMLGVADALASAGFAAIAIDLPLHGVTDPGNPFYAGPLERTFNVDLVDNASGQPGPDGNIDASGTHYINLTSLLTSRDNTRQGVSDLFHLAATVPTLDIDGDGSPDFHADQIRFVGHSLGSMVGTVFLAFDETTTAASLASPGGGIVQLLNGSDGFGPVIRAGLAAVGLLEGTPELAAYFAIAQTTLDAADPINYGALAASLHPIHMMEVVGGGDIPADQIIPNSVPGAPLSGTEPLARVMGLTSIDTTTSDPDGIRGIVRFTEGNHNNVVSPLAPPLATASPATTIEMQTEIAGFAASDGTLLPITNPNVVLQVNP